jgi:hypothetical protein
MGLISTGDEFCRRTDAAIGHLPRLVRVVDDMLSHAEYLKIHIEDVRQILSVCRMNNITLGIQKFNFAVNRAEFAGYIISKEGISVDPEKVSAIAKFPRPTNITQLRSFMGLVNQLTDFSIDIATTTNALRPLMRAGHPFIWNNDHEEAFSLAKRALTSLLFWPHLTTQLRPCSRLTPQGKTA